MPERIVAEGSQDGRNGQRAAPGSAAAEIPELGIRELDIRELDIRDLCRRHGDRPDALIEILHDVQEALGHVPQAVLPQIAEALNLSRADVWGTFSFYHDFRDRPPGRRVLRICRAEACQAVGGAALARHASRRLGLDFGETAADGAATLEAVYCLGNCALGPAVMLDGRLHGRVTPEALDRLLEVSQ